MHFTAETLDDLMNDVLTALLKCEFNIEASRSKNLGKTSEIFGALLQLKNPRARLSRTETKGKAFSAIGEFLWYLTKSNDLEFIKHYIPNYQDEAEEDQKIHGGYGPRLFKMHEKYDQIATVIGLLKKSPSTRRAVIQLFDAADNNDGSKTYKDIPCTCTLQFAIRDNKLNMFTTMRSNDAFLGLPHDVFSFTMLQEVMARTLNVELGIYSHAVGSLHLYENHKKDAEEYLKEGFQSTKKPMPEMPTGDPWPALCKILETEPLIRKSELANVTELKLASYWEDLIRLLQVHTHFKGADCQKIKDTAAAMSSDIYNTFIENKLEQLNKKMSNK